MSDWEVVDQVHLMPPSEWEVVNTPQNMDEESLGMALLKSPFRIGEDIAESGGEFVRNIPGYFESAKRQIPGVLNVLKNHPSHATMQALAGSQEMINKLAQTPVSLARYGSTRLNILPQSVPEAIQKFGPEDTTQAISQLFDKPKYEGEELIRGAIRNIPELFGATKAAQFFNPAKYSPKSIANNILKKEAEQVTKHTERYNTLWKNAEEKGYNVVPADVGEIAKNLNVIEKYKTPREYQSLQDFVDNPSLMNAQKAQSDMSIIHRNLAKKSRRGSLTSEEKAIYSAAKDTEKEIENNMFKNKSGMINEQLKKEYDSITKSYKKNVVPYKYNPNIQAYKAQELLPKELKSRLSRGEFAAKKGKEHPELFRSELIKKALIAAGITGLVGAKDLYNIFHGNSE